MPDQDLPIDLETLDRRLFEALAEDPPNQQAIIDLGGLLGIRLD